MVVKQFISSETRLIGTDGRIECVDSVLVANLMLWENILNASRRSFTVPGLNANSVQFL